MKEVDSVGLIGVFTGGIKATAAGISAAIFFGFLAALVAKPKIKG
jgi:stage V sporulation protein AE